MKPISQPILALCFLLGFSYGMMAQVKLDHLALSVKDPAISVTFYKEVFGLKEIENRTRKVGIRWMALDDRTELHLISGAKEKVHLLKDTHFAVRVVDLDAFISRIKARKIAYSDWEGNPDSVTDRADGARQVYVQDPDGYWIEVNEMPR